MADFLNALILSKDISEGIVVGRDDGITVQDFSYKCSRRRTDAGIPYGPTVPSYLDFTIRVAAAESEKVFFERSGLNKSFRYTFLFNAKFNGKNNKLSGYDEAMIVSGYIVEMEEFFDQPVMSFDTEGKPIVFSDEQQLLRCRLLLCGIEYLGDERSSKLTITED